MPGNERPALEPIPIEDADGYYVARDGSVWSTKEKTGGTAGELRQMKLTKHRTGYLVVTLALKTRRAQFRVHRLIALTFLGDPKNGQSECRHLDGTKTNNKVGNLAWGTPKENAADKKRHGRQTASKSKLTKCQVAQIRNAYIPPDEGNQRELASEFAVSDATIYKVVNGNYSCRPTDDAIKKAADAGMSVRTNSKLTQSQADEIKSRFRPRSRGNSRLLATRFGVSVSAIQCIVSGRTWSGSDGQWDGAASHDTEGPTALLENQGRRQPVCGADTGSVADDDS